ncbi:MAG: hypothetical protein NDI90_09115 [Nitrospira sp. BO4]|jgi:hypothetical protein|nr:hypothetical protein [Nitrospira sp. BO4]
MTHEALEKAVPLYVVGALERAERQTLEAHLLSGCAPCHTAFKEYQSVAVSLPFGLVITPPPRALKGKILAARMPVSAIEPTAQSPAKPSLEPGEWMKHLFPPSSPSAISFDWVLGMVFLAVLIILAALSWNASTQGNGDTEKLAELQAQAETAGTKLTTLQKQLSEREESLTQTREELQRRMAELAEVRDQLIQREAEVDDLKAQLAQRGGRSVRVP